MLASGIGPTPSSEPMRFAFFPLTPGSGNIAKEWLMAATLAVRGDQAIIITCDGIQERCVLRISQPDDQSSGDTWCHGCQAGQTALMRQAIAGPVTRTDMSVLIDPRRQFAAHQAVANTTDDDLLAFVWDNQPFGEWVQMSLRMEYCGEYWQELPDLHHRARQWLRSALNAYLATEGCIRQYRPDCIIVMNGVLAAERAVWECARRHGVRYVTYEQGQRPYTFTLRESRPVAYYDFSEEFAEWRQYPLSAAEAHRLDQFLRRRQGAGEEADYVWSPHATGDTLALIERLDLDPQRPVISLFTNVTADSSVYAANDVFASQVDWIRESIRLAEARPELQLVIRVHPAESMTVGLRQGKLMTTRDPIAKLVRARFPELPSNVRLLDFDDPTSSYDLLQISRVALVYVSTIGMEAAACGLPVLVAGKGHYRDLGFTWSIEDPADYGTQLDRLVATPAPPPDSVALVRRYMYLFYFRGCFHLPALHFLHSLDERPDDMAAFQAGYRQMLALAQSPHPDQVHIRHYLRGEAPFVIPPPPWRSSEPTPAQTEHSQVLVLPDWANLSACATHLLRPAQEWPFLVTFNLANQTLTIPEAASRLATSLASLGPVTTWPDIELLSPIATLQAWGGLLHGIHACVYDPDQADPLVLGLAQQLGIPCLPLTADVSTALLPALPHTGIPLTQAAIYFE